jgi:hypothetical protein
MNVSSTSSVLGHDLSGMEEFAIAGFFRALCQGTTSVVPKMGSTNSGL